MELIHAFVPKWHKEIQYYYNQDYLWTCLWLNPSNKRLSLKFFENLKFFIPRAVLDKSEKFSEIFFDVVG